MVRGDGIVSNECRGQEICQFARQRRGLGLVCHQRVSEHNQGNRHYMTRLQVFEERVKTDVVLN